MKNIKITAAAFALAAPAMALTATPAAAAPGAHSAPAQITQYAPMEAAEAWNHGRHKGWKRGHRHSRHNDYRGYDRGYDRGYYDEPVYRDTRVWRGNDGRYYCRKKDGTTGLIIGAAAGALLGREIDKYGDRTLGTVLGGAAGALLGREVARGGSRCR